MNEQTKEFLLKCKEAGYKFIAICIRDKRAPSSMKVEIEGEQKYKTISGSPMMPSSGGY